MNWRLQSRAMSIFTMKIFQSPCQVKIRLGSVLDPFGNRDDDFWTFIWLWFPPNAAGIHVPDYQEPALSETGISERYWEKRIEVKADQYYDSFKRECVNIVMNNHLILL